MGSYVVWHVLADLNAPSDMVSKLQLKSKNLLKGGSWGQNDLTSGTFHLMVRHGPMLRLVS